MKPYDMDTMAKNELRRLHHKIGCAVLSLIALIILFLAFVGLNLPATTISLSTVAFWGFFLAVLWTGIVMTVEGRLFHKV